MPVRDPFAPCQPVALGDTFGLFHGGAGTTGVIVCEDWGYEGLCARRSLRHLADRLAADGYPVLRFDLPGMGDSLADPAGIAGLEPFDTTLAVACSALRTVRSVERIVLVGLGFGALLAARHAARADDGIAGLVLMAPVAAGRAYVRELQLRGTMIAEVTGAAAEVADGVALSVAGFAMSEGLASAVRAVRLSADDLPPQVPVLTLARPGRAAEEDFARALAAREPRSAAATFTGYDALMSDPTAAEVPAGDFETVTAWIGATAPADPLPAPAIGTAAEASLAGPGFVDTVHVFGHRCHLVGTWCRPSGPRSGTPILFFNAGATPRAGWSGSVGQAARRLAGQGIPSLRIDVADVGDSRPIAGGAAVVHYNAQQIDDVRDALDLMESLGEPAAVAAGTCGGAYLALRGAVADARISDVVAVNLQRLLWDPREDVAEALRFDHTDTAAYARKLVDVDKLKKLLTGQVPVFALARFLLVRILRRLEQKGSPWLFGLTPFARLYRQVHRDLQALAERGVRVELLFSAGDPGIAHIERILGPGGCRAAGYGNLDVSLIDRADHNLTPQAAREIYWRKLAEVARTRIPDAAAAQVAE
ncbi:alpha/beta fold hydrolase [Polymorphum gilvum]|uniref:Putative transmembrane teichuronic acid biosynthesis protein n=1 Tax=Polymorphum gilvum (strain LMG 25793 / CGMCC 1.9160 / SL003B-26A1) TaxID=991905 RepID=F2J5G7_POLGS|nr:alpha/beta fold hydrolase [Polymorphum gilvum]ADZ72337.1 Putative transmembrane teichuronic acid biosynthesis protein [Polymorphum gilvum SL003B-26A1]